MNAVSDRQIAYIERLFAERTGEKVPVWREHYDSALAAGTLTTKQASLVIDYLRSQKYAAEKESATPGYYIDGDEVYVIVWNKSKTNTYGKHLVVAEHGSAHWEYEAGLAFRFAELSPLTIEEATRLSHLHGVCVMCAKKLKVTQSVEAGIGPVCAKKLGVNQKELAAYNGITPHLAKLAG